MIAVIDSSVHILYLIMCMNTTISFQNISLVLERVLNQLLRFVPSHLASTEKCIGRLKCLIDQPEDCIVASLDVVAWYSNIPIAESISAVMEMLEEHEAEVDMFGLSLHDVRELLGFLLESNFFQFQNKVYR